jgi:hypothetical protein
VFLALTATLYPDTQNTEPFFTMYMHGMRNIRERMASIAAKMEQNCPIARQLCSIPSPAALMGAAALRNFANARSCDADLTVSTAGGMIHGIPYV